MGCMYAALTTRSILSVTVMDVWTGRLVQGLHAESSAAWKVVLITAALQCGVVLIGLSALLDRTAPVTALVAWAAFRPPATTPRAHTLHSTAETWRRWCWTGLTAQAALSCLPVLAWGVEWPAVAGFAAGWATMIGGSALTAAFTVVRTATWPTLPHGGPTLYQAASVAVVTSAVALGVMAFLRMARQLRRMDRARDIAVRAATHQERMRIARDLHDLVASRLTMATLRGELAVRRLDGRDERARAELRDAIALTRDALTDLRSLAHRIQALSLADELEQVHAALAAVGVEVTIRRERCPLPAEVENVLASVLREAVTNLLRHSRAEHCRISVRRENGYVVLDVANNGVPRERPVSSRRRGLSNLSVRANTVGGSCTTAVTPEGWFVLSVVCPVDRHATTLTAASPLPGRYGPHRDGCAPRAS